MVHSAGSRKEKEGQVSSASSGFRIFLTLIGKVLHKAAYKAEMYYAEPQHPKAEYKRMGLELRDNNVELVQRL